MDFYARLRPKTDEKTKMRLSRLATVALALVLFGLAIFACTKWGEWLRSGLQIASVAYGALLGVFLLGVLTQRANQRGAIVGMLFGFGIELCLWLWQVPWTWWVIIGMIVTFAVGYAFSSCSSKRIPAPLSL